MYSFMDYLYEFLGNHNILIKIVRRLHKISRNTGQGIYTDREYGPALRSARICQRKMNNVVSYSAFQFGK